MQKDTKQKKSIFNLCTDWIRRDKSAAVSVAVICALMVLTPVTIKTLVENTNKKDGNFETWKKSELQEFICDMGRFDDLAKDIQEQLWYTNQNIEIDGQFGPESRLAVSQLDKQQLVELANFVNEKAYEKIAPNKSEEAQSVNETSSENTSATSASNNDAQDDLQQKELEMRSDLSLAYSFLKTPPKGQPKEYLEQHKALVVQVQHTINQLNPNNQIKEDGVWGPKSQHAYSLLDSKNRKVVLDMLNDIITPRVITHQNTESYPTQNVR